MERKRISAILMQIHYLYFQYLENLKQIIPTDQDWMVLLQVNRFLQTIIGTP
jgi:hypothetical protein